MTQALEFRGRWVPRGGVLVPVPDPEPAVPACINCGQPSITSRCRSCRDAVIVTNCDRVPSHASFNLHKYHRQTPCDACTEAEREYQAARWLRKKAQREGTK